MGACEVLRAALVHDRAQVPLPTLAGAARPAPLLFSLTSRAQPGRPAERRSLARRAPPLRSLCSTQWLTSDLPGTQLGWPPSAALRGPSAPALTFNRPPIFLMLAIDAVPSRRYIFVMARTSKREQLLEAAAVVVRRDGTDRLTLDAVAAQAGVSKGGLLYHFESKRALVAALVDQLIARFGNELVSRTEGETGRGTFSRAYVRASLETADDNATSAALISAVALAPELLDPLREQYRAWSTLLREDGLDRVDALLVRLAVDGLWMADLLGLAPPAPAERKALVERLLAMAGEE